MQLLTRLHVKRLLAIVSAGLVAVGMLATGCWQQALPPPVPPTPSPFPELGISTHNYPRVDGSTSTLPLARIIACRVFDAHYEWHHSETDDSRHLTASDFLDYLNEGYHGEKRPLCEFINQRIDHHGTHEAYVHLIRKQADLILVARKPSADELREASTARMELDIQPVALDAFVFLLNSENPVGSLSLAQIRDIYSGKITNWRQVGGPDAKITPYQRTRNSGSQRVDAVAGDEGSANDQCARPTYGSAHVLAVPGHRRRFVRHRLFGLLLPGVYVASGDNDGRQGLRR
jgi:ABC-type phosphate transport system substrate-binding protein